MSLKASNDQAVVSSESQAEPIAWQAERAQFQARIAQLEEQLSWFKRQLFGEKSERRHLDPPPGQLSLGEAFAAPAGAEAPTRPVAAHRRRTPGASSDSASDATPLFFDEQVPVEVIAVPNPEMDALPEDAYTLIGEKVTHRLAQRPGSYVILKYVRPLIKRKADQTLHCPPAPSSVLEGGRADVSFLAGLVVDKFLYHLPLYRRKRQMNPHCEAEEPRYAVRSPWGRDSRAGACRARRGRCDRCWAGW